MAENIIVTTGIYDLLKEQIRRRRVTKEVEDRLTEELKYAQQVLRRELPDDVVTVNRRVRIKDLNQNKEETYQFVSTGKQKIKKGKYSIMCDMGMATVGYRAGETITWPFPDGERQIKILSVEPL